MFHSLVVGTDGSDTANQAVDEAIGVAAALNARLDIVSAFEPVSASRLREEAKQAPNDIEWMVNEREDVEETLNQAKMRAHAQGVTNVRTYARQGDPADAILDVAEEFGHDLIVVGNKGMTGAKRFLLGSVPNKISHHAPCSVLIVRTS
jgi:nucleotide-binding universal stress UspA family protein